MTDMEKVETDNIAVVKARDLKKYCADHEGCCGCVFDDYDEEGQDALLDAVKAEIQDVLKGETNHEREITNVERRRLADGERLADV